MAVGDLPLAILPAEYVGDSQCVGLDRDADDRICDVFKADHVCHVTTDIGDLEIEAVVGGLARQTAGHGQLDEVRARRTFGVPYGEGKEL